MVAAMAARNTPTKRSTRREASLPMLRVNSSAGGRSGSWSVCSAAAMRADRECQHALCLAPGRVGDRMRDRRSHFDSAAQFPHNSRLPARADPLKSLMNLHEYQAKELFRRFGIEVPTGEVAATPAQAVAAAGRLGGKVWVVKAQVHAGGRGKAGGVKLARSPEEVGQLARDMLGTRLVTKQTGPQGCRSTRCTWSRAARSPGSST